MANILVDTGGNPWKITTTAGVSALPYTLIPNQKTGNMPYALMPLRIRWVNKAGQADDTIIITDWKGKEVLKLVGTGADYQYDVTRPKGYEAYIGPIITTFDRGDLYLYL